jgi:uncharacterized protein YkwD
MEFTDKPLDFTGARRQLLAKGGMALKSDFEKGLIAPEDVSKVRVCYDHEQAAVEAETQAVVDKAIEVEHQRREAARRYQAEQAAKITEAARQQIQRLNDPATLPWDLRCDKALLSHAGKAALNAINATRKAMAVPELSPEAYAAGQR